MKPTVVAIADLHSHLPAIPPCDVLIIGGDLCPDPGGDPASAGHHPDAQRRWLRGAFADWARAIPIPRAQKIATWGNHDFAGFESLEDPGDGSVTFVIDRVVEVLGLKIWLSPWSNQYMNWTFMKDPAVLSAYYESIPAGIDILVSHQPPYGYGDTYGPPPEHGLVAHLGSKELLAAIERLRPRAVVCGHFHRGFGRYEHHRVPIFNVATADEEYRPANPATVIELRDR